MEYFYCYTTFSNIHFHLFVGISWHLLGISNIRWYWSLREMMPDIIMTFYSVLTDVPRATVWREITFGVTVCWKSLVPQLAVITAGWSFTVGTMYFFHVLALLLRFTLQIHWFCYRNKLTCKCFSPWCPTTAIVFYFSLFSGKSWLVWLLRVFLLLLISFLNFLSPVFLLLLM